MRGGRTDDAARKKIDSFSLVPISPGMRISSPATGVPMRFFSLPLVFLVSFAAACSDSGTESGIPTLDGRFRGMNPGGIEIDLSLTEAAGLVSGTGILTMPNFDNLAGPPLIIPGVITGTHAYPTVNLTASNPQQLPIATFAGSFTDANTVTGMVTVTVTGFPAVPLTITRR